MNRSCVECARSKVRCDLKQRGSSCSRCLQTQSPCIQAGRKKRARRSQPRKPPTPPPTTDVSTTATPVLSPETSIQDQPQLYAGPGPVYEQTADLSFLAPPSASEIDFLSQLVDIESMIDMSSWTWNLEDTTSLLSTADLAQSSLGPPIGTWPPATSIEGFVCPDAFRLPADYVLKLDGPETIPVHRLETFARLFFLNFHHLLPLLHIPTFCLATSSPVLVRAICFIGAGFDSDPSSTSDARLIYGSLPSSLAKCCLRSDKSPPTFEELQALVLLQFAVMANGGSAERAATRLIHPLLVAAIRHEGLLKIHGECTRATRDAHSWKPWILKESRKRVLWGVYAVDCYQAILCGSKPLLAPTDTRASFPCDDASWTACSASLWAALPAQDPSSCFLSSPSVTTFGMNLLILAVSSLLLEAQTSILPVDLSALEQALQTWYASWNKFRGQPPDRHLQVKGTILISDSLSLYHLAVDFLRNGRPVLSDQAYLEKSADPRNPLIIREQVYQDEMMQRVQDMLGKF
ncbi:fungal-specific transcription factor domain-containing protein [Stachybotrys elegans]|uniref:Fungal-specific transcription factor domain-containing protein n=1 Tax=Stachybotrys elegans TaxID=80388 RepID=A0A8K0SDW5_9HYPO|nr:fungal-specific transcription factor domain-containing protein [Stachybotrys elegans]